MSDHLLPEREVIKIIAVSRATLWRRIGAGEFPSPVKIASRSNRWRRSAVDQYIASLKA